MSQTIQTLANEYLQTAALIQKRIKALKLKADNTFGDEHFLLQKRIAVLELEYYDTRNTGRLLRGYYGQASEGESV